MNISFETENYYVRETIFSDYEYYIKWETDPDMTKYFALDSDRSYEDVVVEGFAFKSDRSVVDCTIVDKDGDVPVGRIIIGRIEDHYKSVDITKIYVGGNRRGQGIGGEVLVGLIKYLFREKDLERVTLDHFRDNHRAAALYERLGFVREGIARNACAKDGVYYDLHLMSMLREEFLENARYR